MALKDAHLGPKAMAVNKAAEAIKGLMQKNNDQEPQPIEEAAPEAEAQPAAAPLEEVIDDLYRLVSLRPVFPKSSFDY